MDCLSIPSWLWLQKVLRECTYCFYSNCLNWVHDTCQKSNFGYGSERSLVGGSHSQPCAGIFCGVCGISSHVIIECGVIACLRWKFSISGHLIHHLWQLLLPKFNIWTTPISPVLPWRSKHWMRTGLHGLSKPLAACTSLTQTVFPESSRRSNGTVIPAVGAKEVRPHGNELTGAL